MKIVVTLEVPEGTQVVDLTASTNAPQPRSAPKPVGVVSSPAETEWSGLATAEPPVETEERAHAIPPWPEGECPRHHKDWVQGKFGPYDPTLESDTRYANRKGYCDLAPGKMYQGRFIPRTAA